MSETTLYHGDCLIEMNKIADKSVDLILTDLPYGILTLKKEADYQNENRNFCDWDFEINYDEVLSQLKRVMKKDGNILLFAKAPFTFRLYEQMIKHGFIFRYNWIWKKNAIANFASMKYRPGNNYEEVMVFTLTPKRAKYFANAEFNGETKTKCKFYNYKTRTPIPSEEVFDKYLIPYILGNAFIDEDIRLQTVGSKNYIALGAQGNRGEKKLIDLFEDTRICTHIHGGETHTDNTGYPTIKFDQIFKEKYQGQFEIDFENKILYKNSKSYRNFPTSIIDIKYGVSNKNIKDKHPTSKPVEVLEYLLDRYTEEGDTVLDMTMGSGSTGVACKNKNRNFIRNRNK